MTNIRPRFRDRVITLGHVAGIRVIVTPSWFASIALIVFIAAPIIRRFNPSLGTVSSWLIAALLAILLGLSVLAHELGHCFTARAFGIDVRVVRLYLLGGSSELVRSPATARQEALIAGAGPAVSAAVTGIFWATATMVTRGSVTWLVLIEMTLANGVVAVFNILPALPLDGGRVLRAAVWQLTGRRVGGTRAAVIGGYLVGAALVVAAAIALNQRTPNSTIQAAILGMMGFFVAAGAWSQWPTRTAGRWPDDLPLSTIGRQVFRIAASQTASAAIPGGATAVVVNDLGATLGVLDAASRQIARIHPEMIVRPHDAPGEIVDRMSTLGLSFVVLVDEDGMARQIAWMSDINHFLTTRQGR